MPIFDLNKKSDIQNLKEYLNKAYEKKHILRVQQVRPRRSLKQNSYVHLLLSIVAIEMGESLEYVKQEVFKRIVNPDIFYKVEVTKNGQKKIVLRSSADVDTKEMTTAIDRFRDFVLKELNIATPDASKPDELVKAQIEVEKNKRYLY